MTRSTRPCARSRASVWDLGRNPKRYVTSWRYRVRRTARSVAANSRTYTDATSAQALGGFVRLAATRHGVDGHRREQHDGDHDVLNGRTDANERHAVVDGRNDQSADHGVDHLAATAVQTRATDDRRRDGVQNVRTAGHGVGHTVEVRGVQQTR